MQDSLICFLLFKESGLYVSPIKTQFSGLLGTIQLNSNFYANFGLFKFIWGVGFLLVLSCILKEGFAFLSN